MAPDRLLRCKNKCVTEPSPLVVTPYQSLTGAVLFQFVLRVQFAPSAALYKATRAARSEAGVAADSRAPRNRRAGASVPAVATPTKSPGGNDAPATTAAHAE